MSDDTPHHNPPRGFVRFNDREDLSKLHRFNNSNELKTAMIQDFNAYIKLIDVLMFNVNEMITHFSAMIDDFNHRMKIKNELLQNIQAQHVVDQNFKHKRNVNHLDLDKFDEIKR
ncbi:MAG: hypothetical protein Q9191_002086, partial [Dirinaria sp. TL-2023a]